MQVSFPLLLAEVLTLGSTVKSVERKKKEEEYCLFYMKENVLKLIRDKLNI